MACVPAEGTQERYEMKQFILLHRLSCTRSITNEILLDKSDLLYMGFVSSFLYLCVCFFFELFTMRLCFDPAITSHGCPVGLFGQLCGRQTHSLTCHDVDPNCLERPGEFSSSVNSAAAPSNRTLELEYYYLCTRKSPFA